MSEPTTFAEWLTTDGRNIPKMDQGRVIFGTVVERLTAQLAAARAEIERLNGYLKDQSDSIKAYEDEVAKLSAVVEAARGVVFSTWTHSTQTQRLAVALAALEEKPSEELKEES